MRRKLLLSRSGLQLACNDFATLNPPRRSLTQKMCQFMLVFALASSTLLFNCAKAQTLKSVPLDCGGWFSGFAQADNGRLYGYGDVFGAWRSDDGGSNWSYLNYGIPDGDIVGLGMAVQKNNADVVYYSTNDALWKSINGGTNWTALLSDVGDYTPRFRGSSPILIRSNNANEIWFAGPRKGLTGWLWKSSDGGSTWAKAGGTNFDSNKAQTLHNVSTFANQIWVGSDNGLYVSTDGGNNFNLVGGSGRLSDVGMISRFTTGTFAGVGLVTRSNNNGGGISRITATDYNNSATYSVTDAAANNIYFGYPTGLQIFSDGSSSAWNTSADRHGFSPAGDGGQTFTVRSTTLNTSVVPIWTTAAEMAAKNHPDYGTDQVIEAVGNTNKWMITGGGAPMYSLDKGLSWQYFPNGNGLAAVKTYLAGVSRFDANRIYIPASDIGSAIVTDGGTSGQATLSSHKSFTGLHNIFRIMEGPDANNLAIAGVNQGENKSILLKSNNGGSTWVEASLGNLPASYEGITKSVMSINDANDFLVVLGDNGTPAQRVYRTKNGGTSFSTVTGLPDNSSTGFRYGPQNCFIERDATQANVRYFVARDQNFYKSTDGGSNWTAATHPFGLSAWVWGLHTDPVRTNNIWAAGDFAGVKVSRDGGQSWTPTAQFFDSRYVSSCDGKIAVWGKKDGGSNPNLLWYSADDGATWTAQTTVAKNFHGIQGITVDRNGKIWVSWNSCTVVTPVTGPVTADTQAPTVPTSLTSSNLTSSSLTLNWTASTDNVGVTGYEVFRGGTSQGTVTGTSYNATGLTASTAYSFTVRAKDAANNFSAQSSALSVTTSAPAGDTQAPTVPSGLSSSNVTSTSLTLSWTASTDNTGVTGYEVFRGGVSQGTVTTTSYNASGLTASTAYSFTVRAKDAANNYSAQSSALSVTTSVASGGSTNIATTGVASTWNDIPAATSTSDASKQADSRLNDGNTSVEVVYIDVPNAGDWQAAGVVWATSQPTISSIKYYNGQHLNDGSDNGSFTANMKVQSTTNGTTWTDVSGWTITPTYPYSPSASNQTYTLSGTALSNVRGVRVVGQVRTNDLSWSIKVKEIEVFGAGGTPADTQAPTVPTSLTSSNVTSSSLTLNWTASTDNVGVTGYEIFRGGVSQGTVTTTSYNATGLTASTAYSFRVRAKDAANNFSAQSSALSVTTSAATGTAGKYEAESGTLAGGVTLSTSYMGYTGTGYVTGFNTNGANVSFSVNVSTAGTYNVTLRYGNAAGPGYPAAVYINGTRIGTAQLNSNTSWTTWQSVIVSVALKAGANTIKFQKDPDTNGGAYNIDYITIPSTPGAMSSAQSEELLKSGSVNVEVYPNPAFGSFSVSSADGAKIIVTSLDGRVIKTVNASGKVTTIDSSNWSSGMYIIQVQSASGSTIKKVVINK